MGLEADHDPALAVHHPTLVNQTAPHLVDVRQHSLVLRCTAHTPWYILSHCGFCITVYFTRLLDQTALHLVDVRQHSLVL